MNKFKGTSGVWLVSIEHLTIVKTGSDKLSRQQICCVKPEPSYGYPHKEAEANAKLIAAAPDLLKACQVVLSNSELGPSTKSRLEKAIIKAIGE